MLTMFMDETVGRVVKASLSFIDDLTHFVRYLLELAPLYADAFRRFRERIAERGLQELVPAKVVILPHYSVSLIALPSGLLDDGGLVVDRFRYQAARMVGPQAVDVPQC